MKFLKNIVTKSNGIAASILSAFTATSFAAGTTVYDGITTAVTQPLSDALTVIIAIAGLMAVLYVGWKVSKMLLSFVRGA